MTRACQIIPSLATAVIVLACGMDSQPQGAVPLVGEGGSVDWNRYYLADESNRIMREFAALYPSLTDIESIGTSYLGAELLLMTVSNTEVGDPAEKPALYLDGGIHAAELTGSSVALFMMAYLLNNYGSDPRVTELLDTRTFYIRPKFNPDGSDLVLTEDQSLRSTVRPVDEDGDGVVDNDPPVDLDGDGRILRMRVPDVDGEWRMSSEDPRIMVEREADDEGPFYRIVREGLDQNGDGVIANDGIGGIDMNRNFPRNWERVHIQSGSGDFPLSEAETYATVKFINEHPNITSIVHGHTPGGFLYRLPSAMDPREFDGSDEALVLHLGGVYTEHTGRAVRPSATHPIDRRYGTLIQWGYSDQGIIGWVPEYSPGPEEWVPDSDGDGVVTEADWHRYNVEEFDGRYFQDWTPYEHPQLGEVEIGGWHTKYWGQNPPHPLLERELAIQVPWLLYLAERSPMLELGEPHVEALGEERYRVEVVVTNTGYLPTNLTERGFVGRRTDDGEIEDQVVPPPLAIIKVDGGFVENGSSRKRITHLAGSNPFSQAVTAASATIAFVVRKQTPDATVRITVASDKGGTVRSGVIPLRVVVAD